MRVHEQAGARYISKPVKPCNMQVATTDGKEVMRTSRVAEWSEAEALKAGKEAGAELKASARPGFFMW